MLNDLMEKNPQPDDGANEGTFRDLVAAYQGSVLWSLLLELIGAECVAQSAADFQRHIQPRVEATIAEIDEALAGLVKLGFLGRTETGYRRLRDHILIPDVMEKSERRFPSATRTLQVLGLLTEESHSLNWNWSARLDKHDLHELRVMIENKLIEVENRHLSSNPPPDGLYEIYFGGTRMVSLEKERGN